MKLKTSLIICALAALSSCTDDGICIKGQGEIESKVLDLEAFSGIDLTDAADVTIQQGDVQKVTVTGHGNILERLQTKVRNGIWDIDLEKGCYRSYQLQIDITVPDLDLISLSGSGDVYVHAFEDQPNLDLDISGSGTIELEAFDHTKNLDVRISGSGNVIGHDDFDQLQNLDVKISGSGNYDAYPIQSENADIHISGSGDCYVSVTKNLDVNISGSGRVRYHGNPTVTKNISGSGSVKKTD